MSAVGDARKRQAQTTGQYGDLVGDLAADYAKQIDATAAGRDALHAAANYLTQFPAAAGYRVWLLAYAGSYQAAES